MTRNSRFILIAAIVVLVAAMAFYPLIKRTLFSPEIETDAAGPVQTRQTLSVSARILNQENFADIFRQTGILLPDEEVDLTFETSGKITDIYFREGTHVRKGELLAKVNDRTLQAELQKLRAQVPLARARVGRQDSLLRREAVSQESYESVTTELETLLADIDLVEARIAQTELRAPFDGMIGLRNVSEGTYASPTTVISKLTKISPLKIEFAVNESQAEDMKPGTQLQFTVWNEPDRVFNATVYAVETALDRNTFTIKGRARYDNPGGHLSPGRSANINTKIREYHNSIFIPSIAVVAELGRDFVYVYRNGVAEQTIVQKGVRTENSIQITSGLNPGDTLITTGVMQLRDGTPVRITEITTSDN